MNQKSKTLNFLSEEQYKKLQEKFYQKTVLITGGAGFIGSHLCEALHALGANIICVDALYSGKKENIKELLNKESFTLIQKDVIDLEPSEFTGIDYVLNLAARAAPDEYQKHELHTIKSIIFGAFKTLNIAKNNNSIYLFTSTSEVYGSTNVIPTPETHHGLVNPIGPRACYDESKRVSETITLAYAKKYEPLTDSLIVYVSPDCGESWDRVFAAGEDGNGSFATRPITANMADVSSASVRPPAGAPAGEEDMAATELPCSRVSMAFW